MFLQACLSTKEIAPILAHSMLRLFPHSDGALFLMSSSKTDLEAVVRWGESPNEPAENVFSPDACWGLRRGGAHIVDDVESSLACPHLGHLPAAAYACLPLMAKRDVLGLLHIRSRSTAPRAEVLRMLADLRETSSVLSELLSLSISNLRLSETLSIQSIKDPLTGLFNRRYLEETLRREISRAERRQCEIGVVMADIDHFKTFNDLHGHAAGDLVLTELASLLKTRTRGSDIPCRFGGEEFALVFIESSLEHTVVRANELKEEVKQLKLRHEGQEIGSITVSMGVSAYPSKGTKVEELLLSADAALYRAKQAGRDCVISAGT
jgi:diguanylate cyclase (GGDEF)-like protein